MFSNLGKQQQVGGSGSGSAGGNNGKKPSHPSADLKRAQSNLERFNKAYPARDPTANQKLLNDLTQAAAPHQSNAGYEQANDYFWLMLGDSTGAQKKKWLIACFSAIFNAGGGFKDHGLAARLLYVLMKDGKLRTEFEALLNANQLKDFKEIRRELLKEWVSQDADFAKRKPGLYAAVQTIPRGSGR